MSDAKLVNIARLMTTYNFEIKQLPDNLKCAQCKLVPKDACQVPCGCKYCRACIDEMIAKGSEFCPRISEDCGESLLSRFASHYGANKRICKLSVKCPHDGCECEYTLVNMEQHLRDCKRKSEDCPFRELGCTQDKLAAEEMCGHLQNENRRHSEILIEVIANINREIDTLKLRDESSSKQIEMLKNELVLKDGQITSIMDQMIHVQNDNESIKNDIKLIKEEKEDLADQVRILSEEIEREIAKRREIDQPDSTSRAIEQLDRDIAADTWLIGSNEDNCVTETQSDRGDIGSISSETQWIKNGSGSVKSELQSLPEPAEPGYVWLINFDINKTSCEWGQSLSRFISGNPHPYKYRLASGNYFIGTASAVFCIALRIDAGPNDGQLAWPFKARVDITVTDRDRHEACKSYSLECRIYRPPDNGYKYSDTLYFLHSELRKAKLNLSSGVRVLCVIVPDFAR